MELNAALLFSPAIFTCWPSFSLSNETTVERISRLRLRTKHRAAKICYLRLAGLRVHWITPSRSGCGLHRQVESTGIQEGGKSGVSHRAVLVWGAMLCFWLRTAHPGICKGTRHVHVKGTLPVTARLPSGLTLTPVTWPGGHCRMETTTWACRSFGTSLLPSPWCLDSSPRSARTHARNKRDHM